MRAEKKENLTYSQIAERELPFSSLSGDSVVDLNNFYAEEDFESMASITKSNYNCIVTGDDMLVTNEERVKIATRYGACTGAILKVNQAGTLFDALNFVSECQKNGLSIITSHRSGESIDSQIAHVAISTSSKMIHQIGHHDFAWQRSFHDRVIRNEKELYKKRDYIIGNPAKWAEDRNNPINIK